MKEFLLKYWNHPKFCMLRYAIPLLIPILLMDSWCLIFVYVAVIIGSPFLVFRSRYITDSIVEKIVLTFSGCLALFTFIYSSFLKEFNELSKKIILLENEAVLLKCLNNLNSKCTTVIVVLVLVASLVYVSALPYYKYLKSCKTALKNENTYD